MDPGAIACVPMGGQQLEGSLLVELWPGHVWLANVTPAHTPAAHRGPRGLTLRGLWNRSVHFGFSNFRVGCALGTWGDFCVFGSRLVDAVNTISADGRFSISFAGPVRRRIYNPGLLVYICLVPCLMRLLFTFTCT